MNKQKFLLRLLSIIIVIILSANSPRRVIAQETSSGEELIVTTINDNGFGSLRNALTNAKAGDIIHFDPSVFPIDKPNSIILDSVLPYISTGFITIDGIGAGVILDGRNLVGEGGDSENPFISGLIINSDNNVVKNLTINNFPGNGIFINNGQFNIIGGDAVECASPCNVISKNRFSGIYIEGGGDNIVAGNYLGIDATGKNAEGNGLNGVRIINSSRNITGGIIAGSGNLIGANSIGIEILDSESVENKVIGNVIGLEKDLKYSIGNLHAGISIAWLTSDNIFEENIIAGNEVGIVLEKKTHGNILINNYLGTNLDFSSELGNTSAGVVLSSTYDNVIGPGNKIMWNGNHGIVIEDSFNLLPYGNKITENDILNNRNENIYIADSIQDWQPEPPHDLKYLNGVISGFTVGNQVVEIYTDKYKPGGRYLSTVTANNRGYFYWVVPENESLDFYISATSFQDDGTTSNFSNAISESKDTLTTLPGVVGPLEVSTEPKVLYWNFIFAVILLSYCKVMTNAFNKILKKYGEIISEYIIEPFQKKISNTLKTKSTNMNMFKNRWVNWLLFLIVVALIQAWLNPVSVSFIKHLSLSLTIFICAAMIGLIKEMGERIARKSISQPFSAESTKVHWFGLMIAGLTTTFSRIIQFTPGFILGSVEVFSYKPSIQEKRNLAIRVLVVRGAIFVVTLIGWLLSSLTERFSPGLTTILQLVFTIALQGLFFEMLPFLKSMDGSVLIRWNFWSWIGLFLPISYFTFWLVLNPNGSGIKAIQQNSITTLIVVLVFLAIMVLVSDLIFKRIEKKKSEMKLSS